MRHCPIIFLEGLRKTVNNRSQVSRTAGRESNLEPPDYEGVLPTQPCCWTVMNLKDLYRHHYFPSLDPVWRYFSPLLRPTTCSQTTILTLPSRLCLDLLNYLFPSDFSNRKSVIITCFLYPCYMFHESQYLRFNERDSSRRMRILFKQSCTTSFSLLSLQTESVLFHAAENSNFFLHYIGVIV
jgi:hypothetical protein